MVGKWMQPFIAGLGVCLAMVQWLAPGQPVDSDLAVEGHGGSHNNDAKDPIPDLVTAKADVAALVTALGINTADIAAAEAAITALQAVVPPIGTIVLWSGSVASIPAHWQLCDGSNGTPNLKDVFVYGAGGTKNPGDVGGAVSASVGHDNNHSTSTDTLAVGTLITVPGGGALSPGTIGHTHTAHSNHTIPTLPPYYALAYIMRVS